MFDICFGINLTFVSFLADNWWCFMDESVFTRMVDLYKSIVVFLLKGGKTLLVPVFYENYFVATLRLLEKLHKVISQFTCCFCKQVHQFCADPQNSPKRKEKSFLGSNRINRLFPGVDAGVCSMSPGKLKSPPCGVQPLLYP